MKNKNRYQLLDNIRGIALISMIIYHGMWDMVYIFGIDMPWYESKAAYLWQQSICWTFIILSGFCWSLGKRKLKRGMLVLTCSTIISLVTVLFMPDTVIIFGILCLIGTGMLVMMPLDKVFEKINPYIGLIACFSLFLFTRDINKGILGFGNLELVRLPDWMYKNLFTAYLGFPSDSFYSSDYFPVLPWLFLYQTGYFLYKVFKRKDILERLPHISIKPLEWVGRQSLLIYMLHQPMVYAVLYLILAIYS